MKTADGRHARIKLCVTWNWEIRARIKESGKPAYQVTVGGEAWRQGKGQPYQEYILGRLARLTRHLTGRCRQIPVCLLAEPDTPQMAGVSQPD